MSDNDDQEWCVGGKDGTSSRESLLKVMAHLNRKKFQYRTTSMQFPDQRKLDEYGEDGWELAGVWHDIYILKREIK